MNTEHTTHTIIVGAGFAGLYLAHLLRSYGHDDYLIVAPDTVTVSDKSYYNFRSRGIKQQSLKMSMYETGKGRANPRLVNTLVRYIDDELTALSTITKMHASYLGAQVSSPPALLAFLRERSAEQRVHAAVTSLMKQRGRVVVHTTTGTVSGECVVLCTGGDRGRLSAKFADERIPYDMHAIAARAGCVVEALDRVLYHPFYTNGACLPSDGLSDFVVVDERGRRLSLTTSLLVAHNAHHRFEDICREYAGTRERFAVRGTQRIPLQAEPHYVLGGIRINMHGETTVRRIYALGECSFGMHGHGRIGGCALSEILVMARVIARSVGAPGAL